MSAFLKNMTITAIVGANLFISGITYGQDVNQAWLDRFNGEINGVVEDDGGYAIGIDSVGNIYVTGYSFQQVQSNLYSPRYATIKYAPDGTREWSRFERPGGGTWSAVAQTLTIDSQDNVVIAGSAFGGDDWAAVKYDPQGTKLWSRTYQANSTFLTHPSDIAVDGSDNIFVTGLVGSSINPDFGALVKFKSTGVQEWVAEYYGPEFDGAGAMAVATDQAGNSYIAGYALVSGRAGEAAIVKYDPAGNLVWQRTSGSSSSFAFDIFRDIAIDSDGNIVVSGEFGRGTAEGADMAVQKYDSDGNQLWARLYDARLRWDTGDRLAVDNSNNITVVGITDVSNNFDALIVHYDSNGNFQWAAEEGGKGSTNDYALAVVTDAAGNIYVTGIEQPFANTNYYATYKFSQSGTRIWKQLYGGPREGGSYARAIAVSDQNEVYVTGESIGLVHDEDIVTIKYEQSSQSIPATLTSFEIVNGTLLSGTLSELTASDDLYVNTRSGFGETLIDLHNMEMIVNAITTVDSASTIDLTIESRIDEPSGLAQIRMHNWNNNQFESVGSYSLGNVDQVNTINGINVANYIDGSGNIDLSIKHLVFVPFLAFTFESFVDHVEIVVVE